MNIRNIIGTAVLTALFSACAQEDIVQENNHGANDGKVTLKIIGEMPSEEKTDSRTYVGEDKGVYWIEGDKISVVPENLDKWGFDLNFFANKESEGKKKATFLYTGDYIDFIDYYFPVGSWFTACYPALQVKPKDGRTDVSMVRTSTLPATQYQNGESSRHLNQTMVMLSGKVDVTEKIEVKDGIATLPKINFTHRSAVHRFLVTNRQEYPIKVKSVQMTALLSGTQEGYPVFNEEVDFHMGTLEAVSYGRSPHKHLEVVISHEGKPYYTLEPGKSAYFYVSSFATDLKKVDLRFSVTTDEGTTYHTLALPGSKIKNGKFEYGMCYTYDLLVDNNLSLQGWEVDYIDNVDLGQQSFTLSTDKIALPLDGNRKETITIHTSDASGWTITEMPQWVTASLTSGSTGESQITFSAQANASEREGEVCIASGNLHKYLKIVQSDKADQTDAIYLTKAAMQDENITRYILQDNEPDWLIHENPERSFSTMNPLQSNITTDEKLHLRFYSPRKLTDVQVWAKIPSLVEEEFLLATLEEIAPFADVYAPLPPFGQKDCKFKTISGKEITFKAGPTFPLNGLKVRVSSSCEYWKKLKDIKVNWSVKFGKPINNNFNPNNWGMKAAHCREAVSLALNNTYMFSTNEYRDGLYALQGQLYSDDAGKNIVDTHKLYNENILQPKTLHLGVASIGGFAGGHIWYFIEDAYMTHYADDAVSFNNLVIWHEFGHVLGYGHEGNMTYPNKDNVGWANYTGILYYNMSKEKKLPIYSRRFLHTRDTRTSQLHRESNRNPVKEWHSFGTTPEEDAELYEIDGGDLWYND